MKNQALFSSKDKSKKIKMSSAVIFVWCFKGSCVGMDLFYKEWLDCFIEIFID